MNLFLRKRQTAQCFHTVGTAGNILAPPTLLEGTRFLRQRWEPSKQELRII